MKSVIKVLIIVGSTIVLLGIILGFIGLAMVNFNFRDVDSVRSEREEVTYTFTKEEIKNINLKECMADDVKVVVSDEDNVKVTCFTSDNTYYELEEKSDGTLEIDYHQHKNWYEYIGFNFGSIVGENLLIEVPQDFCGNIDLNSVSGDITVEGLSMEGHLTADATSGEINIKNIYVGDRINLSSVSGDINAQDITIESDLKLETTSGEIEIYNFEAGGELIANSVSGSIDIGTAKIGEDVKFETTSGEISFENISGMNFEISSVSGEVEGNVLANISDYKIEYDSLSGDVNMPTTQSGELSFSVETTSGDVDITFNE